MEIFTFIVSSIGLFFFGLSFSFKNFKRGTPLGIKTKWTILSDDIWDRTHIVCGKVWKISGLVISASPIIVKKNVFIGIVILAFSFVFTIAFPYLYSKYLYKKSIENNSDKV